jgi:hypothetical protein
MNPFLESPNHWEDFHNRLIARICDALVPQIQPKYRARLTELLFVQADEERFEIRPDSSVLLGDSNRGGTATLPESAALAVLDPPMRVELEQHDVAERHWYIEIQDRQGREVVTAIELLSRSNKRPGKDRAKYLAKRDMLMEAGAHFIEIDLLRSRPRLIDEVANSPKMPPFDYYVMLSRVEEQPSMGLWPIRLREKLPLIPVPLRAPDPDVTLDLQSLLHATYDAAGYAAYIYDDTVDPPLESQDAQWADGLLREAGITAREIVP